MIQTSTCPPKSDLECLTTGSLPPQQLEAVMRHLESCDRCVHAIQTLSPRDTLVELVMRSRTLENGPDDDAVARLVARLKGLVQPQAAGSGLVFACSACGKKLKVKAELAGKKIKCPHCGQATATPARQGPTTPRNPSLDQTLPPRESVVAQAPPDQTLPPQAGNSSADRTEAEPHQSASEAWDFLAPAQQADELGRLGGYRVLKVLGQGGMGVVFRAEDPGLQRLVAIKAMLPSLAASPSAKKRFLREARAAAAIKHDHIVTIHQVGEDRGAPFLAMEFLDGEPLDERLKRENVLPLAEVLRIGREMAEGLAAAHERGLIHRDVKPANVWLEGKRGRVKILDFGLARSTADNDGLTQQGAIVGTPSYMAPEQANGQIVDARCDLFSLGCVLYRMATGALPFRGSDTLSMLASLVLDVPKPPRELNPTLPPELSELVMTLLEKEPDHRPTSAVEVVQRLQNLEKKLARQKDSEDTVVGVSLPAPRRAAPAKAGSIATRRRLPVLVAALVLLVGLIGVGAWALIRIQTPQGDYVIDTDDPDFSFQVGKGTVTLQDRKTSRKYNLKVVRQDKDEHELEVTDIDADLAFKTKSFTIKRGQQVALKAWFERKEAVVGKQPPPVDDAWVKKVAAMPADKQVEAVIAMLKERNPGLTDREVTHMVEDGKVTEVMLTTNVVKDIAPVRALTELRKFNCSSTKVADLSPLKDMKLTNLYCSETPVSDLSPLKNMKLTELNCNNTLVSDLSPLKDMKLTYLICHTTQVSDLSPLKDMKLTTLICYSTPVSDLSPLKDMMLTSLQCGHTPVSDLSPLKDMKLLSLVCGGTKIADLSPLKNMKLENLECQNTNVSNLSPLKDMKLGRVDN